MASTTLSKIVVPRCTCNISSPALSGKIQDLIIRIVGGVQRQPIRRTRSSVGYIVNTTNNTNNDYRSNDHSKSETKHMLNGKFLLEQNTDLCSLTRIRQPTITRSFHKSIIATLAEEKKQYSTPELTEDAARHKAGIHDPTRPSWQNPLHHNNKDMDKIFPEDFDTVEEFEAAMVPAPPLEPANSDGSTLAPEYIHAIADEICHLTLLEMNELLNKVADHFGFYEDMLEDDDSADTDASGGGGGGGGSGDNEGAAAEPVVEKTTFDIRLVEYDASSKIKIIKEVRALAGLGLKEAKEVVEGAPKTIVKDVKKEQAEEIKAKLEEIGAKIEIV